MPTCAQAPLVADPFKEKIPNFKWEVERALGVKVIDETIDEPAGLVQEETGSAKKRSREATGGAKLRVSLKTTSRNLSTRPVGRPSPTRPTTVTSV